MRTLVVLGFTFSLVTASVFAQAQAAAPAQQPSPETVEEGKKLFTSYGCYQCHGYEGQGGAAGPRIGPRALPYAGFGRYVRRPVGQMPPYTTRVLADADLEKIYAYVQSRPAPKPASDIPLLK